MNHKLPNITHAQYRLANTVVKRSVVSQSLQDYSVKCACGDDGV